MTEQILNRLTPDKLSQLVGDITLLLTDSNIHRNFPLADVRDLILPPVHLNQFRIYHTQEGKPVGLVVWGNFSQTVLDRYLSGDVALSLDEWNSGNLLVFTDFIAPYGHALSIVKDLRTRVFPTASAYALRFKKIGEPRKTISRWFGSQVTL